MPRTARLTKLLIVLLAAGVLIGVAMAARQGQDRHGRERVARQALEQAHTAARRYFAAQRTFRGITAADFARHERALSIVFFPGAGVQLSGPSPHADPLRIYVHVGSGGRMIVLCNVSEGRYAYCLRSGPAQRSVRRGQGDSLAEALTDAQRGGRDW